MEREIRFPRPGHVAMQCESESGGGLLPGTIVEANAHGNYAVLRVMFGALEQNLCSGEPFCLPLKQIGVRDADGIRCGEENFSK